MAGYRIVYNLLVRFTDSAKESYGYTDINWTRQEFSFPYGTSGDGGLYSPEGLLPSSEESSDDFLVAQAAEAYGLATSMLGAIASAWVGLKRDGVPVVTSAVPSIYQIYRDDDSGSTLVYHV
jgi:hypothetical protein